MQEHRLRKYLGRWVLPGQTFYRFAELGVAELRRLKQLEQENRKLKTFVAYLTLDKQMLQDVLRKML